MYNLENALFGIKVLSSLQTNNGREAVRIFREEGPTGRYEISQQHPGGEGAIPPFMVAVSSTDLFIFATGVQNRYDAREFALGYARPSQPNMRRGSNSTSGLWATRMLDHIVGVASNQSIHFYGHSAGGCTVEHIASYLEDRNYGGPFSSMNTYGAPSAGFASCYTLYFRREGRSRWMVDGDAVPFVPCFIPIDRHAQTSLLMITALGQDMTRNVQPAGGLRLNFNRIDPDQFPIRLMGLNAAVNAWMAQEPEARRLHSADNYLSNLAAHVKLEPEVLPRGHDVPEGPAVPLPMPGGFIVNPQNQGPPAAPATPEGPQVVLEFDTRRVLPPSGVVAAGVSPAGDILVGGQRLPATIRSRNMAQARLGKSLKFFVVKVGTKWQVGFLDLIVASYSYPSSAKTLARAGNRFLRLLGNRGGVMMPDFADVWPLFVGIASTDATQYRPVLQVNP